MVNRCASFMILFLVMISFDLLANSQAQVQDRESRHRRYMENADVQHLSNRHGE